jgi:hypothetical protein
MSMDFLKLPPALQQKVTRELQPGEVVSWAGQPDANRFMLTGFALWLFFIPWTAFALFWVAGAAGFKWPDFNALFSFFPLFGLPFVLIGVGGLLSPFFMRAKARDIIYVVTSKRAFSLSGGKTVTLTSWLPEQLGQVTRTERPDGSGDLVFSTSATAGTHGEGRVQRQGFLAIRDVRAVEMYVQALAARGTRPSAAPAATL